MNDQRNAPTTPIISAKTIEETNWEITETASIFPEVIKCSSVIGIANVNTSVSADSMMSVALVFGVTAVFLTNPTTTADEVPPSADPMNKLVINERLKINIQQAAIVIVVTIKPSVVMPAESLNDSLISAILSSVPLSNRIKINTKLLKREPNFPNEAGSTILKTGPIRIPVSISPSTSGIFFD